MGKKIQCESFYLISDKKDNQISWEYNPKKQKLSLSSMNSLDKAFLKGLQDFIMTFNKDQFYQLKIGKHNILGKLFSITRRTTDINNQTEQAYLVLQLKSSKRLKSNKLKIFAQKVLDELKRFFTNSHMRIFNEKNETNLKEILHKLL